MFVVPKYVVILCCCFSFVFPVVSLLGFVAIVFIVSSAHFVGVVVIVAALFCCFFLFLSSDGFSVSSAFVDVFVAVVLVCRCSSCCISFVFSPCSCLLFCCVFMDSHVVVVVVLCTRSLL